MAKIPNTLDELRLQKLVVELVKEHGGFAVKLAHRHLVGVPDLFVQIPFKPALFLEAKQVSYRQVRKVPMAVTGPQFNFLKNAALAGMRCGVICFLQTPDAFGVVVEDVRTHQDYTGFEADPNKAVWGSPKERKKLVWEALQAFYMIT